jgi:hypothetical protein
MGIVSRTFFKIVLALWPEYGILCIVNNNLIGGYDMTLKQAIRKAKEMNQKYGRTYLVSKTLTLGFRVDSDLYCSCWPKIIWENIKVYRLICT